MEPEKLITALKRPQAFPYEASDIFVLQTHISIVFLAGEFVYKLKKAVSLGFLDFSTLEARKHYCEEEVRLNRRLAPQVYLGVVPVTEKNGGLQFEGDGEPVEWAVKMRRVPDEAILEHRIEENSVNANDLQRVARRLAEFHVCGDSSEHITQFGRFKAVAENAMENFRQTADHVGRSVSPAVYDRAKELTERRLDELRDLIDERAKEGMTKDTHGDLRVDHVYLFPDEPPPNDIVILDCIEFNERFRFSDPIADVAFLVMDLQYHGRRDLAKVLVDAYVDAANDHNGRTLGPFYCAYRAIVRAKVEGMKAAEPEVPPEDREQALQEARAHWLLALVELDEPSDTPCVLLIGGLPGTGKSTLARSVAQSHNFQLLRTDVVRKELAGAEGQHLSEDYYTPEWNEKTYDECLRRTERWLFEGQRVLVDASFREEKRRQIFIQLAKRWGVPILFLHCEAPSEIIRQRLEKRVGDASDANWDVFLRAEELWQAPSAATTRVTERIDTNGTPEQVVQKAETVLRHRRLIDTFSPDAGVP